MAKIIALFNNKGGVSKTTTTFHLGWKLAELGYKTLMIDTDPQCNLTGLCLNADKENKLTQFYEANNYNIKNTGDEVINILLNYYLPSLDKNTEIKITGKLSESFCSETFDTNIIIGNIIKNSVEELQKDIVSKKIFEMSIEEGMKFKRIAIMNTIVNDNIKHNSNRRHYGYGIGIVEYYVKKNHGKYEIKKENNKYKIAITIPKK